MTSFKNDSKMTCHFTEVNPQKKLLLLEICFEENRKKKLLVLFLLDDQLDAQFFI